MRGGRAGKLLAMMLVTVGGLAATAVGASAESEVVYNNIPSPLPGNTASVPFYGEGISEFGGQVEFGGTARKGTTVTATLSSWACVSGQAEAGTCQTPAGSKFEWPITLSVYAVGAGDEPGARLAKITHTFKLPYRPSASSKCTGAAKGGWYDGREAKCFNAKLVKISFPLRGLALPPKAIISVGFNTTSFGPEPVGTQPCSESPNPGCPYNLINVGLTSPGTPAVGTDPVPNDAYLNTPLAGDYCENEAAAGHFALSKGCWEGLQATLEVKAKR